MARAGIYLPGMSPTLCATRPQRGDGPLSTGSRSELGTGSSAALSANAETFGKQAAKAARI